MIFVARYGVIASTFPSGDAPPDLSESANLYSSYGILTIASDSSSSSQSSYGGLIFIE